MSEAVARRLCLTSALLFLSLLPFVIYFASPAYRVRAVEYNGYDVGPDWVHLYTVLELDGRQQPVEMRGHPCIRAGDTVRLVLGCWPVKETWRR